MIFRFARRALRAEVPLLPDYFPERLPAVRRPTQDILLSALSAGLCEVQPDSSEWLRMVKRSRIVCFPGSEARHPKV